MAAKREPAVCDIMNILLEITSVYWPGQGNSCLHLCPRAPNAEPQALTDAMSSISTYLLWRCLLKVPHSVSLFPKGWAEGLSDPLSERMGQGAFKIKMLKGNSYTSIF